MKKIISLATVIAIVFASFVMVGAVDQPSVVIGSLDDVLPGASESVDVELIGSAAIIKLKITASDGITITGVTNQSEADEGNGYNSEKGTILLNNGTKNLTDVTLVTIEFDVADDAAGQLSIDATVQATVDDGANGSEFDFEAESGIITIKHEHSYTETTTPATCTEPAKTIYTCACGESYEKTEGEALGHDWTEWEVTTPATEESKGEKTRTCKREGCKVTETEEIPVLDHVHVYDEETFAYDDNTHYNVCTKCKEPVNVANHTIKEEITKEASCTETGLKNISCEVCGYTKNDIEIPLKPHTYGEWTVTTAPTCTEKGIETRACECGNTETRDVEALGHTWDAGVVTKEPTKTEEGEKTFTCTACGTTKTETIAKIKDDIIIIGGLTTEYTITTEATVGGTVTATQTVEKGSDLTVEIVANRGYKIADVLVDGESVGAVSEYKFENVRKAHTVSVVFEKLAVKIADEDFAAWENPFTDVSADDSFYEAVAFANLNGLFKGVTETEFAPETTMTRAMFVTVLGRLAGVDVSEYTEVSFIDVVPTEYYAPYVAWANANGIVEGYNELTFGVSDNVTIEQAAVIIARYAAFTGIEIDVDEFVNEYADAELVSDWAAAEMMWADANGIYNGIDGELNPQGAAARSLVAEMLYAFVVLTTK